MMINGVKRYIAQCSLLGALCLLCNVASAQYFNSLYDFDTTSEFGRNLLLLADGTHLVVQGGYSNFRVNEDNVFSFNVSPDGSRISNKKVVFQNSNYRYGLGHYGMLAVTNTNQVIFPYAAIPKGSKKRQVGILKLNLNADSIFARVYTDTFRSIDGIYDVGQRWQSDRYFAVGFTSDTNDYFGSANGMLLITDTNGNLLRRKIFEKKAGIPVTPPNGVACMLESVEGLIDGRILIGGSNGNFEYKGPLGPNSKSYAHFRPWFILADSAGNIIRDTSYDYGFSGGGKIRTDRQGGYLHWGELDTLLTATASNYQNWPHYVAHLDSNFRMSWLHVFASLKSHTQLLKTMQLSNGDYLALGRRISNRPEPHGGFAARLSRTGNLKWERTYLTSDTSVDNYLADAAERPNGSIVMVGVSFRNKHLPAYRGQDCWLLSVDSNGCEIPNCAATGIPNAPEPAKRISIYPNPTSGQLNIQAAAGGKLSFYDPQGTKVALYEIPQGKASVKLPASMAAGLYLGVVNYSDGQHADFVRIIYRP